MDWWDKIKDKGATIIVATLAGGVMWIWQNNTMDWEVKPAIAELKQGQEQTTATMHVMAKSAARSEVSIAVKDMARIEGKPRDEWTDADKEVYRNAKARIDGAMEDLASLKAK